MGLLEKEDDDAMLRQISESVKINRTQARIHLNEFNY